MRVCVNLKIIVLLIGFSAAILVGAGSAKADFIFGTPTNLGPTINSSASDHPGRISVDGLRLYFSSRRPEGIFSEWYDIWVTARPTKDDPWEEPVYLGPAINTANSDFEPDITPDELTLVFTRFGSGGPPNWDVWITTRSTTNDPWGSPMNLGTANDSAGDGGPSISADGLTIFFESNRSGGHGDWDVWMTTRPTIDDPWGESINLDSTINSSRRDGEPSISADGRMLFFSSERPGGTGGSDLYVTTRPTTNDPWGTPINLGQTVNSSANDGQPAISLDGRELYFRSNRPGGQGGHDIWQAPILPVVDFNGDGIVDSADMCIMVDYWGTDEPLCDIGPMPWGDGIVDVQDLIILAEHLFEEFPPVE
jgi:Tol biopolymer transport system component